MYLILVHYFVKFNMTNEVTGQVVLITGGAGSIGQAIADHFLKKKARVVVLLDINEEKGEKAAEALEAKYGRCKAIFLKCDVTLDLEWLPKRIYKTFGTGNIVINCAGIIDETNRRKTIEINAAWPIDWTLKFWRFVRTDKGGFGGTIINIASTHATKIDPFLPTYQAANLAVVGFTKSLGHSFNYNKFGVRVMALCPGFTDTPMMVKPRTMPGDEKLQRDFLEYLESQHLQDPDVVGKAAVDMFEKAESGEVWAINNGKITSI